MQRITDERQHHENIEKINAVRNCRALRLAWALSTLTELEMSVFIARR